MADTTQPSDSVSSSSQTNPLAEELQDLVAVKQHLGKADDLKIEGNKLFKASKWSEALVSYRTALSQLPSRQRSAERDIDPSDTDVDTHADHERPSGEGTSASASPESELGTECSKARAVLYANIGACLLKLDDHKGVVDACTQALRDDPHYVKALQRRAASSEKIDTWTSLSRAQQDYKLLVDLLPAGSLELTRTRKALQLLEPRVQAAQNKETTEMMDKLKGLGNTILGKFGLSTDNFKFEPNGQGGYSMNFVQ
ncbi:TPR-like protein [Gyrodon lividus]|nr:TPR-like protein [Gyrodon lividus]